jgi:hypothetical protein
MATGQLPSIEQTHQSYPLTRQVPLLRVPLHRPHLRDPPEAQDTFLHSQPDGWFRLVSFPPILINFYFLLNIFPTQIPCVGISFLTALVFYLPSDGGEKVCRLPMNPVQSKSPNAILLVTDLAVHLHSDLFDRVLPAAGGNHSVHLAGHPPHW